MLIVTLSLQIALENADTACKRIPNIVIFFKENQKQYCLNMFEIEKREN